MHMNFITSSHLFESRTSSPKVGLTLTYLQSLVGHRAHRYRILTSIVRLAFTILPSAMVESTVARISTWAHGTADAAVSGQALMDSSAAAAWA